MTLPSAEHNPSAQNLAEDVHNSTEAFRQSVDSFTDYVRGLEETVAMFEECATDDTDDVKNDVPLDIRQQYTLAFEDVFKGQSALDPSKWQSSFLWGPDLTINKEEQYYVDVLGGQGWQPGINPFKFGPNGLIIEAAPIAEDQRPVTTNGIDGGQRFTSGVLINRDALCFTGGFVEVCLKPPCNADGSWPAAWLLNCMYYQNAALKNDAENGGVGNDKFNPEIDWEWVTGGSNPGTMCAKPAYHYFTGDRNDPDNYRIWDLDASNFTEKDGNTGALITAGNIYETCDSTFSNRLEEVCEVDYCQDFHTYGIHWEPNDFIHFYIDGQLKRCVEGPNSIITDQSMYFLMNLAVGGSFPFGNPPTQQANQADYPAQLEIEYVRIYTK